MGLFRDSENSTKYESWLNEADRLRFAVRLKEHEIEKLSLRVTSLENSLRLLTVEVEKLVPKVAILEALVNQLTTVVKVDK